MYIVLHRFNISSIGKNINLILLDLVGYRGNIFESVFTEMCIEIERPAGRSCDKLFAH